MILRKSARAQPSKLWFIFLVSYLPVFWIQRTKVFTDTKLYLATAPGDLLANATTAWDSRQFSGFVPHQNIGYLWPSGPYFWLTNSLNIPLWIAQRLWIGTIIFIAGWGAIRCCRRLGISHLSANVAALTYMFSPFILTYNTRSSVLLLPWAGLGHIVATCLDLRDNRIDPNRSVAHRLVKWRTPAVIALIVLTVGGINATALLMIAPAPLITIYFVYKWGEISKRTALGFIFRTATLCLGTSMWWLTAVAVQGKYGSRVLSFSETLEAVSHTSTASEILRGLGHWLNYVTAHTTVGTTTVWSYANERSLMISGFLLVVIALLSISFSKTNVRAFAATLIFSGLILAIGVHPITEASPAFKPMANNSDSFVSLSFRSSTRAIPLLLLGFVMAFALGLEIFRRVRFAHLISAASLALLTLFNFVPLRNGELFDNSMARSSNIPNEYQNAIDSLNKSQNIGRVLVLPGSEFGVFDWGYTMDPPQVGLLKQPILTRDLLPLGGAGAMDLFYALDDRIQTGNFDPESFLATARLLGVSDIWVSLDQNYKQYNTVKPQEVLSDLNHVTGLSSPTTPSLDNTILKVYSLNSPTGLASLKTDMAIIEGSGDGLISAAAMGLLSGFEATTYASSYSEAELRDMADKSTIVIVTDSNRARARQWRGSRDTVGATESVDESPLTYLRDVADRRLDIFGLDTTPLNSETRSKLLGPVRATASSYGSPTSYLPEYRPNNAIDGDIATAWRVAEHANPIDASITVTAQDNFNTLRLVQPTSLFEGRWITQVVVSSPDFDSFVVDLGAASRTETGQNIKLPQKTSSATITIKLVDWLHAYGVYNLDGVGFSEIDTGLRATSEVIQVPDRASLASTDIPVAYVFERQRVRQTDVWRSDPETVLARIFNSRSPAVVDGQIAYQLDLRATDAELADVLGLTTIASQHRIGDPYSAGWAATDGDESTSWKTRDGTNVPAELLIRPSDEGDSFTVRAQRSTDLSQVTAVTASVGGVQQTVPTDESGIAKFNIKYAPGDVIRITASQIDPLLTSDIRTGDLILRGYGITEVTGSGLTSVPPERISKTCVSDLLTLDDGAIPFTVDVATNDFLSGNITHVTACEKLQLNAGQHKIQSFRTIPVLIDAISLTPTPIAVGKAIPLEISGKNSSRTIDSVDCKRICTLVFSESFNEGWKIRGVTGEHVMVDGGYNGWIIGNTNGPVKISLSFAPQRYVNLGLLLTVLATVVCLGIIFFTRRFTSSQFSISLARIPKEMERNRIAGLAFVLAALLLIGLTYGLFMILIVGICLRWPTKIWSKMALLGTVYTTCLLVTVFVRYQRRKPEINFDWTLLADGIHKRLILAILIVVWGSYFHSQKRSTDRLNTGEFVHG